MPKASAGIFALSAALALVAAGGVRPAWSTRPIMEKARAGEAAPPNPVVVELYQSQGCSSCPPANAYLNAIADRRDILSLSFAVTYWDQLGWKDTFGSPRFTARQQEYARAGRGQVATPELIVNGTVAVVGANRTAFDAAIANAGPARGGPQISFDGSAVRLAQGTSGTPAIVWLVRYDPRSRDVPIRAGENGGRTLPHRDIVREFVKLGEWRGPPASFGLPTAREPGLATAVLVQRGTGGPIVAARKL
jgi:hypothetical protein